MSHRNGVENDIKIGYAIEKNIRTKEALRKIRVLLSYMLICSLMFSFVAPICTNNPGNPKGKTIISASAKKKKWEKTYSYNGNTSFSVTKKVKYKKNQYSIKITNKKYNVAYVQKTFKVKKNTHYKASVLAKISGYKLAPKYKNNSGVSLGKAHSYDTSERYTGKKWKRLVYEFDTGNKTKYSLALYNGMFTADCKGSAYFCDFKLEECVSKPSNKWNVMVVCLENINASVMQDGKKQQFKGTLNHEDALYLKKLTENIYTDVPLLSDGRWGFDAIDLYEVKTPITKLAKAGGGGYCLDFEGKAFSQSLDAIIQSAGEKSGKRYDQIVVFCPLQEVAESWLGLGGTTFHGINICQLTYQSGSESYTKSKSNFPESAIVHEMLHCVNRISNEISQQKTVALHENIAQYGSIYEKDDYKGWDAWGAWYSDYMRRETPDHKGIDPKAFYQKNSGQYKVVYGKKISYKKKDIGVASIGKIADQVLVSGSVNPKVAIKYGKKTLKEGTDYTLSYYRNDQVGIALVKATGKGKYSGSITRTFTILPLQVGLNGARINGADELVWTSAGDVDCYEIFMSTDGGNTYTKVKTVDGTKTTDTVDTVNIPRVYKVRGVRNIYPKTFAGADSNVLKME